MPVFVKLNRVSVELNTVERGSYVPATMHIRRARQEPIQVRPEKKRIDTSADRIPLTDSPFAQLAGLKENLPAPPAPPKAEILPDLPKKAAPFRVEKTRKGGYNLAIEKRSGGKVVTVIRGIDRGAEELLGALKKLCGAGGALREEGIEIQGDHRDRVERFLKERLG